MKAELLIAGWLTVPAGVVRRDESFDRLVRLPIPAYLIETESERILVDTGPHALAALDPARRYGSPDALGPFRVEVERPLAEQIDLSTVTKVVMTHLHYDHAGGLDGLGPSVPVVVQRREWEAAHDRDAVARNFFHPADYADAGDRVVLVDGEHDLLGDGSVTLLPTPGHTPGHQSVRLGDGLVIAGDVVHFAAALDDERFPVFADSFGDQTASARRLRELRDGGATVLPGHDPEALRPGPL